MTARFKSWRPIKLTTMLWLFSILVLVVLGCTAFLLWKTSRHGYESQPYTLIRVDGDFEIRDYPPQRVITTDVSAPEQSGRDGSFMKLFRYIDGGNSSQQKIAMTTPVLIREPETSQPGSMSFLLPSAIRSEETPLPVDSDLRMETLPASRYAALRFQSRKNAADAAKRLEEWIRQSGFNINEPPAALFAYYDPPWIPEALSRNEVLIKIASPQ